MAQRGPTVEAGAKFVTVGGREILKQRRGLATQFGAGLALHIIGRLLLCVVASDDIAYAAAIQLDESYEYASQIAFNGATAA